MLYYTILYKFTYTHPNFTVLYSSHLLMLYYTILYKFTHTHPNYTVLNSMYSLHIYSYYTLLNCTHSLTLTKTILYCNLYSHAYVPYRTMIYQTLYIHSHPPKLYYTELWDKVYLMLHYTILYSVHLPAHTPPNPPSWLSQSLSLSRLRKCILTECPLLSLQVRLRARKLQVQTAHI